MAYEEKTHSRKSAPGGWGGIPLLAGCESAAENQSVESMTAQRPAWGSICHSFPHSGQVTRALSGVSPARVRQSGQFGLARKANGSIRVGQAEIWRARGLAQKLGITGKKPGEEAPEWAQIGHGLLEGTLQPSKLGESKHLSN